MYNRYVDGLAAPSPSDPASYRDMGEHLAAHGYGAPPAGRFAVQPGDAGRA